MRRLLIRPIDFELDLEECPLGLFLYGQDLCFKSGHGKDQIFHCDGVKFVDKFQIKDDFLNCKVIPVMAGWKE